jgi:putative oxidoreductase
VLVAASGVIAFVGGLSILLGFHTRVGAWLLVVLLLLVTPTMHDFWNSTDPTMRALQTAHFLKNVALLGAALLIAYFGGGPVSMDDAGREKRPKR